MTPTERAQLAAAEHYDARARAIRAELADPAGRPIDPLWHALDKLARARSAELLDPEPTRYTLEPDR